MNKKTVFQTIAALTFIAWPLGCLIIAIKIIANDQVNLNLWIMATAVAFTVCVISLIGTWLIVRAENKTPDEKTPLVPLICCPMCGQVYTTVSANDNSCPQCGEQPDHDEAVAAFNAVVYKQTKDTDQEILNLWLKGNSVSTIRSRTGRARASIRRIIARAIARIRTYPKDM